MSIQRFIYPSIWRCPELAAISSDAQLLFIGCFSTADDEGRRECTPALLRADIFPLRADMTDKKIKALAEECDAAGLIRIYGNGLHLDLPNWHKYQKPKYKKESKIPPFSPEPAPNPGGTRAEPGQNLPRTRAMGLGLGRDGEGREDICSELETAQAHEPPVFYLDLIPKDGSYPVTQPMIDEWSESYPGVDVIKELKKAIQWSKDNPTRRKTKRGAKKFLGGWLSRAQDRAGQSGSPFGKVDRSDLGPTEAADRRAQEAQRKREERDEIAARRGK